MAKLNYLMADGAMMEFEVSEEFIVSYEEMEKEDAKIERSETRRHQSLEKSLDRGHDFVDKSSNVEELAIRNVEIENLRKIIENLEPQQQELIQQIFFKYIKKIEIARRNGVDKSAISHKLENIYKKIRKYLK